MCGWGFATRVATASLLLVTAPPPSRTAAFLPPPWNHRRPLRMPLAVAATTTSLPPGETDAAPAAAKTPARSAEREHGGRSGFVVHSVPSRGFPDPSSLLSVDGTGPLFLPSDVDRLNLTSVNATLTSALMMFDRAAYPSVRDALRAIRDGKVRVRRGGGNGERSGVGGRDAPFRWETFDEGSVGDRVYPDDVVAIRTRPAPSFSYAAAEASTVPFDLPVVYEDDHMAVVDKPGGVEIFSHRRRPANGCVVADDDRGDDGEIDSVRSALPYVLRRPSVGAEGIVRRPECANRLDKPTCGLVVVGKTRAALANLARQFEGRTSVTKTYLAVVYGTPPDDGDDTDGTNESLPVGTREERRRWNVIDAPLGGKEAVTRWRVLRTVRRSLLEDAPAASVPTDLKTISLLELQPKTGRYRQLRRHLAKELGCPIVGDAVYGRCRGKSDRGEDDCLFLSSVGVMLDHPYYNTKEGRQEWDAMQRQTWVKGKKGGARKDRSNASLYEDKSGRVVVQARIEPPEIFQSLLGTEGPGEYI